jgi:hypothetical protein
LGFVMRRGVIDRAAILPLHPIFPLHQDRHATFPLFPADPA